MTTSITIRDFEDAPLANTPRYWYGDDPFLSHFYNALSSTFPEGERFFIRAVRHYADDVSNQVDPEVVRQFIGQEGRHSKAHDGHMALLDQQGYPGLHWFNKNAKNAMSWLNKHAPRYSLALTVAIEHVTAVFAHEFLENPDRWIGPMAPEMQQLWRWHAIEEAEHKAVAFDVYAAAGLPLWLRRVAMIQTKIGFLADVFSRHSYLMIKDRQLSPRLWLRGIRQLFGKRGILRALAPHMNAFYSADFHPNNNDNNALLHTRIDEWGFASS